VFLIGTRWLCIKLRVDASNVVATMCGAGCLTLLHTSCCL
jgi:hypothetical protein